VENATKLGSALVGMTVLVALATPATAGPESPWGTGAGTPQGVGGPEPISAPAAPQHVDTTGEPVTREERTRFAPRTAGPDGKLVQVDARAPSSFERQEHAGARYVPGVAEGFSRGADGVVLHTFATDAGWSPWTPIGGLSVVGTPSGVHQPATRSTEVFARGADGRLAHAVNAGTGWSQWTLLGDQRLAGDPLAVHQPNTGTTEVFARGADGRLVHTDDSSGEWSEWTVIGDWTVTGPLTPVENAATGTTEVVVRTTDGHVVRVENAAGGWAIWSVS
jgi:hypothetical protein